MSTLSTSYREVTTQLGDQWVAAIKRTEDAVASLGEAAARVPVLPGTGRLLKAGEAIGERLPRPGDILAANFALTERLLHAQRDLALRVVGAITPSAPAASAPKASAPKASAPKASAPKAPTASPRPAAKRTPKA